MSHSVFNTNDFLSKKEYNCIQANFYDDNDNYVPYVPIKQRRLEKLHKYAKQRRVLEPSLNEDNEEETPAPGTRTNVSLLDQAVENRKNKLIPGM